ncbi:MAG TPA: hypothetical protein VGJ71_05165 [Candidatus Limnocylindrales bacterium]
MRRPSAQSSLGIFWIIATLVSSLLLTTAVVAAAGNPSATLDQCANGSATSPDTTPCQTTASEWVNGNLGASKAHYNEGDSVPYRFTFSNLASAAGNSHAVTLEWDTTKSDKHALDYITTWNRTVTTSNPCIGVSGCSLAVFDTESIPADPQVTGAGVTPVAGNFTLFGGTITNVSAYTYANGAGFTGDKSARITVTFAASVANPVLAWGGHIATRLNWGLTNSAVSIPGSPYHMRLIDLDGSGGNQDRSLSADAVTFPGSITIIKDASPNDPQDFAFTTTGGLTPATFSLDDDSSGTLPNTQVYSDIQNFTTYTATETTVAGWAVSFAAPCAVTSPNGGSSSASAATATVTITMKEGENYTCTFTNTRQNGTITLTKVVQSNHGGNAGVNDFGLSIGTSDVNSGGSISATPGTNYALNEDGLTGYEFVSISGDAGCPAALGGTVSIAPGGSISCTITNRDLAPTLALNKTVSNTHGGNNVENDFVLSAAATGQTTITDAGGDVLATDAVSNVEYTLSETSVTGYSAGTWSCSGTGVHWAAATPTKVTLDEGAVGSCSITNSDVAPTLALVKVVDNSNGGGAVKSDFTLTATATGSTISGTADVSATAGLSNRQYTLTESGPTGYLGGDWSCTGGGVVWDIAMPDKVTLNEGATGTCTITNSDVAPQLKLDKTVSNIHGGNGVETDFVLSATPTTGTTITDAGGDVGPVAAVSNVQYTLSETVAAGYTGGAWSCAGTGLTWSVATPTKVTLAPGADVTCSITNTDVAPTLALNKTVANNSGGDAVDSDFTLTATPTTGTAITGPADVSAAAAVSNVEYTLSESSLTGYSAGTWSCSGTGVHWAAATPTKVTLDEGATGTCAITNTDVAPTLALTKTVSNTHGGDAVKSQFTLTATPATGSVISGTADVAATAGRSNTTYTLSESTLLGYTGSDWSCSGTGVHWSALTPNEVTLDEGAAGTCGITNSDSKNDPNGETTMSWVVQDSASYTIRAGAADAASATIEFKLYSDALCATQVGTTHSVVVTISGGGATAAASDTTGYAVGVGTYRWRTFYSGDNFNNAASTACGSEVTTISTP